MTFEEQETFITTQQVSEEEIKSFMVPFTMQYQERLRFEARRALQLAENLLKISSSFTLTQESIGEQIWKEGLAIYRSGEAHGSNKKTITH